MKEESRVPEQPAVPEPPKTEPEGWGMRRLLRRIENVLFTLVAVLIFLYFLLQSSVVQNWLIGKITAYLSSELQTRVELRHVDISFFDNLLLEGLYVEDQHQDTLLYAESLAAGLNSNILSLLSNKLEFNEIKLTRARFNIRRYEGETQNNLQFILDFFSSPQPKNKKKSPFRIRIQNMRLTDVQFQSEDQVRGKKIWASLPNGVIRVRNLDIPSKVIDVQSIFLEGAAFSISQFPGKPGTPVSNPEARKVSNISDTTAAPNLAEQPFRITVGRLVLKDNQFSLDKFDSSPAKTTPDLVIDYNHLAVRRIAVEADSVYADGDLFFRENSGTLLPGKNKAALSWSIWKPGACKSATRLLLCTACGCKQTAVY